MKISGIVRQTKNDSGENPKHNSLISSWYSLPFNIQYLTLRICYVMLGIVLRFVFAFGIDLCMDLCMALCGSLYGSL